MHTYVYTIKFRELRIHPDKCRYFTLGGILHCRQWTTAAVPRSADVAGVNNRTQSSSQQHIQVATKYRTQAVWGMCPANGRTFPRAFWNNFGKS